MSSDSVTPIKRTDKTEREDESYKTRPVYPPKSEKDFRKLAKEGDRSSRQHSTSVGDAADEEAQAVSIFTLSAKQAAKGKEKQPVHVSPTPEELSEGEQIAESGFEASYSRTEQLKTDAKLGADQPGPADPRFTQAALDRKRMVRSSLELDADAALPSSKTDQSKKASKMRPEFGESKPDLASISMPAQNAASFETEKSTFAEKEVKQGSSIRDLAAQLIKEIQTIRTEGRTDTVVTLRYPPIFEGATVTLTALDSAKNQFNIAFASLSENAKLLLDNKLANDSLTQALERKGIQVHVIITTTQVEAPLNVENEKTFNQSGRDASSEEREEKQDS